MMPSAGPWKAGSDCRSPELALKKIADGATKLPHHWLAAFGLQLGMRQKKKFPISNDHDVSQQPPVSTFPPSGTQNHNTSLLGPVDAQMDAILASRDPQILIRNLEAEKKKQSKLGAGPADETKRWALARTASPGFRFMPLRKHNNKHGLEKEKASIVRSPLCTTMTTTKGHCLIVGFQPPKLGPVGDDHQF